MMPFVAKLLLANLIIVACAMIGKRYPSLGGLMATMPLTSLIVLLWLWSDNRGDNLLMTHYTAGVLWGIIPTILFFTVAYLCFTRNVSFPLTLILGSGTWLAGALVHQWLLK